MLPVPPGNAEPENAGETGILEVRPLPKPLRWFVGLALLYAADLAGFVPHGRESGVVLTLAVIGIILKECVRRHR
jgi:hypothetical protein